MLQTMSDNCYSNVWEEYETDRQDIIIHNMIAVVCRKDWSRKIAVNILSSSTCM